MRNDDANSPCGNCGQDGDSQAASDLGSRGARVSYGWPDGSPPFGGSTIQVAPAGLSHWRDSSAILREVGETLRGEFDTSPAAPVLVGEGADFYGGIVAKTTPTKDYPSLGLGGSVITSGPLAGNTLADIGIPSAPGIELQARRSAKCDCTNAELDGTFGMNGWRWQKDKEGTDLGNDGNIDKRLNRKSYDVAGKNFPNDPGRFYFAARVKITVSQLRTALRIPITVKAFAWCVGVSSYGKKGDVNDDKLFEAKCRFFKEDPVAKTAWIEWARMIYQLSEEEAKKKLALDWQGDMVGYFTWTELVPCKTGTYDIVVPIPPAPLCIDESERPHKLSYSHVKHMCSLEACGRTLLGERNWKDMDRKLNVWDSSKGTP